MIVNLAEILTDARKNKYGVGFFNAINYEMAKGVIDAAEETKSPVIIGTAEGLLKWLPLDELTSFLIPMAKKASVPIAIHFDHGYTKEIICQSMEYGFTSVMYDCSTMSDEDNARAVADIVKIAHARNISVEAELGHVGANANSAEGDGDPTSSYTVPADAKAFYDKTGVDALAVAIGSAHGAYKHKPELDLKRLEEIAALVPVPLVLHGGSGLSEYDFKESIKRGINKVNIFTDINAAGAKAAHDSWKEGAGITDIMPRIIDAIKETAIEKFQLFGSVNRA